jgi:hypothetical protein
MQTATKTQAPIIAELKSRNIPFTSFYITNMINIEKVSLEIINLLAQRKDVKKSKKTKNLTLSFK